MTTFISLLRGINVGGNKKIKMAELRARYESLGFSNVQTLLQSGNVVFESDLVDANQIAAMIEADIQQHFGFESHIIIRTIGQLREVVQQHPYNEEQLAEPSKILITFLDEITEATAIASLMEKHTGPEVIHPGSQELYLFYPDGMGRSKLNNAFIERRLKIIATGRNWNTVNKLLALAEGK